MPSTDETGRDDAGHTVRGWLSAESGQVLTKPALLVALTGAVMLAAYGMLKPEPNARQGAIAASAAAPTALPWIAAAPGRIEPRTGEIRVGAPVLGRISEVHVRINDEVGEGDLLVRLDDEELRARLNAAEAEAGARKRERDAQSATSGRDEARRTEDAAYVAERLVATARNDLDTMVLAIRNSTLADDKLADVRKKLNDARERLARDRAAQTAANARVNLPSPNRFESSLTAGRAEVAAADALLEKTRLRAPLSGRVLQLQAKVGETVSPSPEQPLVVIGDMTVIRVKAEVDERDVGKLKVGQSAFVRSEAFGAQTFDGKISAVASALGPPRIGQRGPRRPTDVEVLEVTIDLDGVTPLLPGMRVDAFFRKIEEPVPEPAAAAASAAPVPAPAPQQAPAPEPAKAQTPSR